MSHRPSGIIIFGATGDLMRRKLGPALYRLHTKQRLPADARIIGFALTPLDDDAFREMLRGSLEEFAEGFQPADWESFASRLHYVSGDLTDLDSYHRLRRRLEELERGPADRLYYLAIAPRFFAPVIAHLGQAGMAREKANTSRRNLVIEKPFGRDRASARELSQAAHAVFAESQVSLCIQPDEGVHLKFDAKVPDQPDETRAVDLEFHYASSFPCTNLPDAYERLLLDALDSDASLFARSDEIDGAWRLIDPLLDAWEANNSPDLASYKAGSWGPEAADALLRREGRRWRPVCGGHSRAGGAGETQNSVNRDEGLRILEDVGPASTTNWRDHHDP